MQFFNSAVLVIVLAFAMEASCSAFNNRIIDFVLKVARTRALKQPKIQEMRMPGNISMSKIVIDEILMGNMLNLYRVEDDSHLELSEKGFGMKTALEIRNITMRGRYAFSQWPLSLAGDLESHIGKVTVAADITLDKMNFQRIHINQLKCITLEDVELRKMTGAFEVVRSTISSTLNSWLGKRYIRSAIETTGVEYIRNEIDPKGSI